MTIKKLSLVLGLALTLALMLSACGPSRNASSQGESKKEIVVSAAASLTAPMGEIESMYEKEYKGSNVVLNFGSAGALQLQIENGAKVDMFISAAKGQMDALENKGLIDKSSRVDLLGNKLILISPSNNKTLKSIKGLTSSSVKTVAMGEPTSVPVGKYGSELLGKLGILGKVKAKSVYGKDVKQVLSWVETGNVDAGFVYYSDAKGNKKVRIVENANPNDHSPIIYPASIIKNSGNPATAKDFMKYLKTKKVKNIFVKYGFSYLAKSE